MFDAIFLIFSCLYLLTALKIGEWSIISKLGFVSSTPQGFITHPNTYRVVRSILFYTSVFSLFGTSAIPWYVGIIALLCGSFVIAYIARSIAFNTYRANHQYLLDSAQSSTQPYSQEELAALQSGRLY